MFFLFLIYKYWNQIFEILVSSDRVVHSVFSKRNVILIVCGLKGCKFQTVEVLSKLLTSPYDAKQYFFDCRVILLSFPWTITVWTSILWQNLSAKFKLSVAGWNSSEKSACAKIGSSLRRVLQHSKVFIMFLYMMILSLFFYFWVRDLIILVLFFIHFL